MKKESTKKIFQRVAAKFDLRGRDKTFFMRHGDTYLIVNLQKASDYCSFYINGGLSYIDLLSSTDLVCSPFSAYNNQSTQFPIHVDFRAENVPNSPITQAEIDAAASSHDAIALENIIFIALESMILFARNHGDRKEVRRLKQAKLFPAIIKKRFYAIRSNLYQKPKLTDSARFQRNIYQQNAIKPGVAQANSTEATAPY
ncbi:hypothetical protein [Pseudomonas sp. CES]|uniref:hypothetical protein n=1 Tax=Pseudomonas sp. CES TaxID=2719586 RepID=UPI001470164C|nr:hypothetical protein [Pseudomonas sp. CES]KAF4561646.1 hypothetical protein HBJ16_000788 [Pseudomonas sp. CES]